MRIKTHELTGQPLAWAVAHVAKLPRIAIHCGEVHLAKVDRLVPFEPLNHWPTLQPLLERFGIVLHDSPAQACRELVATRFPLSLEVPDALV